MNDLGMFLLGLAVLIGIAAWLGFLTGRWLGRGQGYDEGLKAGFVTGRRTERECWNGERK